MDGVVKDAFDPSEYNCALNKKVRTTNNASLILGGVIIALGLFTYYLHRSDRYILIHLKENEKRH